MMVMDYTTAFAGSGPGETTDNEGIGEEPCSKLPEVGFAEIIAFGLVGRMGALDILSFVVQYIAF